MASCTLCPRSCQVNRLDGQLGFCKSGIQAKVSHFLPHFGEEPPISGTSGAGTIFFSNCNCSCIYCQNYNISQAPAETGRIEGREFPPHLVVAQAMDSGCASISYTYTEPTIFFEYAYDCSVLAHRAGIKNIFVTNGFMTAEALEYFHPYLDGANVDLKSFRDRFYRKLCGAKLQPVLDTLTRMKEMGIWVEVTTLVIPGLNDSMSEIRELARFIKEDLGPETPWHVSRFHPQYKATNIGPTSPTSLQEVWQAGLKGKATLEEFREVLKQWYQLNIKGIETYKKEVNR